jgi:hypothetical protein
MAATQTRAAPPPPGQRQPGGAKILGVPRTAFLVGLAVVVGGIVYFLARQRKASQAAAAQVTTATGTAATPAGSVEPVDWSGEISTLQTEIADLQSSAAEQEQDINQQAAAQGEQEQDIAQDEREDKTPGPKRRPPPREPCPRGLVRNSAGRCVPAARPKPRRRPRQPAVRPGAPVQGLHLRRTA